ncbi:MAG: hypothetical protein EOP54_03685 [Sphingobacteriales bacterium]|nr:MAG: hypothetical protein EOP54_03685 [Sphingobacteriales bacterium]
MRKRKLLYFSLVATFLFWLYIVFKMINVYNSLQAVQGTITKIEKSGNRIPVYTLHLQQYKSSFISKGNGTLSLLKPVSEANTEALFYIREQDATKTAKIDVVPAFGVVHYKFIDCYYFVVRPALWHHLLIIFSSFMICCINALAYAACKTKITWRIFIASILVFLLLMLL